jgi:DNA repair exonuclease SbcCD ATPase subunit
LNPLLTYVKFVLTDDRPNNNNMRIPKEEFANLIRSGLYTPIKMAEGQINDGHDQSKPLGVIVHLKEQENRILGMGVLWNEERPEDIELIKQRYAENKPLDLSWEIGHKDSFFDDDGVENLTDCILKGTTLVGLPAYAGRTIITEVQSSNETKEDSKLEELEKLQKENKELKESISELEEKITELEESQITDEIKTELSELREFKETIEKEALRLEQLEQIKQSFTEAGVEKEETFFEENEETLLSLAQSESLEFFIQQLVVASKKEKDEEEEDDDLEDADAGEVIPNINVPADPKNLSPKQLGKAMRNKLYKKE